MAKGKKASVQRYLLIDEIKDGTVLMKDGGLRSIVLVSSMNFALKSEDEKNAIIASFQQFVNALTFPIQILIRSRKLNLDDYLTKLETLRSTQRNPLLKDQIGDYIAFIDNMLDLVNIMEKSFFVVVPFYPPAIKKKGPLPTGSSLVREPINPEATTKLGHSDFKNYRYKLTERVDAVVTGMNEIGLRAAALNTQEIIELFYTMYNPSTAQNQKLVDANELTAPIITTEPANGRRPGAAGGTGGAV